MPRATIKRGGGQRDEDVVLDILQGLDHTQSRLDKAEHESHRGGDHDDQQGVEPDPRVLRALLPTICHGIHGLGVDGQRHDADDEVGHEQQQEDHLNHCHLLRIRCPSAWRKNLLQLRSTML